MIIKFKIFKEELFEHIALNALILAIALQLTTKQVLKNSKFEISIKVITNLRPCIEVTQQHIIRVIMKHNIRVVGRRQIELVVIVEQSNNTILAISLGTQQVVVAS